jgi:putative membrane protein
MYAASIALVALIAVEHLYILALEMFWWTKPRGLRAFGNTQAQAEATAVMAKNQGLYNGFLAAGLLWSIAAGDPRAAFDLKVFFLGCVVVAGLYGAATASRKILWVQAAPAFVALVTVWLAHAA